MPDPMPPPSNPDGMAAAQLTVALLDSAPVAIVTVDRDGCVTQWNAAAERLFGWTADEVLGRVPPTVPEESREAYHAVGLRLLAGERVPPFEGVRLHRDGTLVHVHIATALATDHAGEFVGVVAFYGDITARVQAEHALGENRRRLQTLLDNLPGVAYRCRNDAKWTMEYLSDGCEGLTGYAPDLLIANAVVSYAELIHPLDRDLVWHAIQPALAARAPFVLEYRIRTRDGQEKWVREQGRGVHGDDGELVALEGFVTDISERKRMEVALRADERFLASIFDSIQDGISVLDSEMNIVRTNAAMHRWPHAGEGLVGRKCYEAYHNRGTPCETCPSLVALQTGQEASAITMARGDDGNILAVAELFAFPLVDADTCRVTGVIEYVRDISARVRAEEELRAAHAQMRTLVEVSPLAIIAFDARDHVTTWNPAAEHLLGWTAGEIVGHPCCSVPPNLTASWRADVQRLMGGDVIVGLETQRLTRHGTLVDVALSAAPRFDPDGTYQGMVVLLRDITEHRRADARLQANAQRMREVLAAADALLACATTDEVLRRGVELARERLGLERCSIALMSDDGTVMRGTYGTGLDGETTNEHDATSPVTPAMQEWLDRLHHGDRRWEINEGPLLELHGNHFEAVGRGWVATTAIRSLGGRLGVFYNDCAISGAPPNADVQEAVALYCSALGNILERKRSEEQARHERDLLRTLLNTVPDAIYFKDAESRFLRVSRALAARFGLDDPEAAVGRTDADFFGAEHAAKARADEARILATGEPVLDIEEDEVWPDGSATIALTSKLPLRDPAGAIVGTFGVSRDITDRTRAEERTRAMAEGLRAVLAASDELLACPTLEDLYRRAVEIPRERLGMQRTELFLRNADGSRMVGTYGTALSGATIDLHGASYPTPDDGRRFMAELRAGDRRWLSEEKTIAEWTGQRYVDVSRGVGAVTPIVGPRGRIGMFLNDTGTTGAPIDPLTQDILAIYCSMLGSVIERRQAENSLFAEKERLMVTLRSIGDGVITTDREGRVVLINKVAEAMTGWTQTEAAGRPLAEVFHIVNERTRETCENPVFRVLATGSIVGLANHTMLIARDGTERMLEDSAAPIFDRDSRIVGVVLVFRDVTIERRVQEDLQRADKLQSVGVLAGGIAHDFNNVLAAIVGHISLARTTLDADSPAAAALAAAEHASGHARNLTQQLLTFAQGGAPVRRAAALGDVLRESVGFANRGANVRADVDIPDDLWAAEIDAGQISQVIQNLVINAAQAMPGGGVIDIRAENHVAKPDEGLPIEQGPCVVIRVADQGCGIPPDVLPRVFDPYFTTKPDGTGLGLATAYSVMHRHHGGITVQSREGEGSTFTLYLPAVGAPTEAPREAPRAASTPLGGRALLMDDDEIVREVVVALLEALGFETVATTDGAAAVAAYREAHEAGTPFDVVIMDLTVPGAMGGKDAIVPLRAIDPDVRAIVSSGYSNDPVMGEYARFGFSGVIAKPYRLDDLRRVLQDVLRNRTSPTPEAIP